MREQNGKLKERTSISLDPDLFAKGKARKARRDFSNYLEVLIEADLAAKLETLASR